jgi:glycosyltransferase involved in cell wall biosynthesis
MEPTVTVIIPVYNAETMLRTCLEHLTGSGYPNLECIVVDDGSTDSSAAVALEFGAKVLRTAGRFGPARARNLGAKNAKGNILFFMDSDVCAYPDTVQKIAAHFADPELDAVIGSYDESPGCKDFLSQYRNLMHCFVHQNGRRTATTFWSGCGAIRRSVFLEFGGFDESYKRPAIEDIELGYRLSRQHRKIVLDKTIVVKHLKRWTFWGLVTTDIFDRGIPWTELILRDRFLPNDLNLQVTQRISVALIFVIFGMSLALAIYWKGYFLTPLFTALFLILSCYWVEAAQPKPKVALFGVATIVAAIVGLAYSFHMLGLIPLVLLASLLLVLRYQFYSTDRGRRRTGWALGIYIALATIVALAYLPGRLTLLFVSVLLVIVFLNRDFYIFLARRGRLFALAAIPFHLLYHFYCGVAFLIGLMRHSLESLHWRSGRADIARQ